MSTKLDEYKKLYAEYVELTVEVHNHHTKFLKKLTLTRVRALRGSLLKMRRLVYPLKDAAISVIKEMRGENPRYSAEVKEKYRAAWMANLEGIKQRREAKAKAELEKPPE